MIKRLIRWLARQEIAEARAAAVEVKFDGILKESLRNIEKQTAYLEGIAAGTLWAFNALEDVIRERAGRDVTLDDVKNARKRLVH